MFWDIIAQPDGERVPDNIDQENFHLRWSYDVKIEGKIVFGSVITGQYDLEPTLQDFLNDFSMNFNSAMMGFAKWGAKIDD